MTSSSPVHPLVSALTDTSLATLLTLGDKAQAVASHLCPTACHRNHEMTGEVPCGRYGAILLSSDYAGLNDTGWTQLLSHLRIHVSPRLWVLAENTHPLGDTDYLALGFSCLPPWSGWRCYAFDLHSYKTTPDWLNARHWAHPERWEP